MNTHKYNPYIHSYIHTALSVTRLQLCISRRVRFGQRSATEIIAVSDSLLLSRTFRDFKDVHPDMHMGNFNTIQYYT